MKYIKIVILLLILSIYTIGEESPKPIAITDQQTKQDIANAYNAIVSANKDFQIALLKAKVKYKIPEDWEVDLNALTFTPPKPKNKDTKP
jgi:hypothetical protein